MKIDKLLKSLRKTDICMPMQVIGIQNKLIENENSIKCNNECGGVCSASTRLNYTECACASHKF